MWRDCETELDFLDFDYLINSLTELIRDDDLLPSSIGVYGDWGSGKSSLIHMSINKLSADEDTVCIAFNGWLFEGYEDAKTAILGSILDAIKENRKLSDKAMLFLTGLYKSIDKFKLAKNAMKYGTAFFLGGGIAAAATAAMDGMLQNPDDTSQMDKTKQAISEELNNTKLREDIRAFQNQFVSLLTNYHSKLSTISKLHPLVS